MDFSQCIASSYDDLLSDLDAALRSIPLEEGFSPTEWERFTDCSIPKKAKVLLVQKMRTICLMDPAYNMNNKAYGRFLMDYNERKGTLAEEQSGSRKGKRAADVALQKVLTMDILRQLRRAGFLCSNDAMQCYDRIVHSVAILAMLSRGGDSKALHSLFSTLQNGEHSVMTGRGISTQTYGGKSRMAQGLLPLQGVLQGNGMGPFIWALISTVLISCMHQMGHVAVLTGCLSGLVVAFMGYAFVDDTDLCYTARDNETPATSILHDFQAAVDCWEGVLRSTGGGIGHDKTFWHLLDHKWTGTKWVYQSSQDAPGEISMRLPDSEDRATLTRKEAHEASETLGIFMAMDGNQKTQTEELRKKAVAWSDAYRTSTGLEHNDAWEGLLTTILSTFKYPATATTMTEAQWDEVMKPVLRAGLPKSGFARNFPREPVFGPRLFQGLGVMHPFHYQELEHLETILRCGNSKGLTGQLLQLSLEAFRLELGLPGSVFAANYDMFADCITDSWLKTVWKHCQEHDLRITDPAPQLQMRREQDKFLMLSFFQKRKYSKADLRKLNVCRCFLKATTLSDICTADGKNITDEALEGIPTESAADAPDWPRQPSSLPKDYWDLWKRALTECFVRNTTTSRLWHPLGGWRSDPLTHWPWHFSYNSQELYHREGDTWRVHRPRRRSGRPGAIFVSSNDFTATESLPVDTKPASVTILNAAEGRVMYNNCSHHAVTQPEVQPAPTTLSERLAFLPPNVRWAVESLQLGAGEGEQLGGNVAAALLRRDARAVSDGSYKEGHGTSAFVLHGDRPDKAIRGANVVPGSTAEQCAYRSELCGVVGILTVVEALCEQYGLTEGRIEIGLDGESVIKRLQSPVPALPKDKHYDLLLDCKERIKALPIDVSFRWIEGHQDDKGGEQGRRLDWWAKQNIRMDAKAKRHWKRTKGSVHHNLQFSRERWAIWLSGNKLSSFKKERLYEHTNQGPVQQYWQQKNNLDQPTWATINWEASREALAERQTGLQRFHVKFGTGHFACGRMMLRRKHWTHSKCPRCGADDEDKVHVIRCPSAQGVWTKTLQALRKWMVEVDTHPSIRDHVMATLKTWVKDDPLPTPRGFGELRKALQAQNNIGAWNLLLGRTARGLEERQTAWYASKKSKRTGKRWVIELIKKLMNVSWDMWDHRNGILKQDPTRHFKRDDLLDANANIDTEWTRGSVGLLRQDLFLFRSREDVDSRSLERKREWLAAVTAARAAATAATNTRDSYASERRSMQRYLQRHRLHNTTTTTTTTANNNNNRTTNNQTDPKSTQGPDSGS